jgi:hypothetical protein
MPRDKLSVLSLTTAPEQSDGGASPARCRPRAAREVDGAICKVASLLGQRSRDVLVEVGYAPREIDDLIKEVVIAEQSRETRKQ